MNNDTVKFIIDPDNLPELTEQQKKELATLQAMPDEEIDTSDIPPLSNDFWQNAVRNKFYKPTKKLTTVRVDADILLWLKSKGKGYQTRLNGILRKAMLEETK